MPLKTQTLDLSTILGLGAKDIVAEIIPLAFLSFEVSELALKFANQSRAFENLDPENFDPEDLKSFWESGAELISEIVISWNVPGKKGTPLAVPQGKADWELMKKVPLPITTAVIDGAQEDQGDIPLASTRSSRRATASDRRRRGSRTKSGKARRPSQRGTK